MAEVVKFKFSLEDTVYFMSGNKVSTGSVKRIKAEMCSNEFYIFYILDVGETASKTINGELCFSSKAKLLKSL